MTGSSFPSFTSTVEEKIKLVAQLSPEADEAFTSTLVKVGWYRDYFSLGLSARELAFRSGVKMETVRSGLHDVERRAYALASTMGLRLARLLRDHNPMQLARLVTLTSQEHATIDLVLTAIVGSAYEASLARRQRRAFDSAIEAAEAVARGGK